GRDDLQRAALTADRAERRAAKDIGRAENHADDDHEAHRDTGHVRDADAAGLGQRRRGQRCRRRPRHDRPPHAHSFSDSTRASRLTTSSSRMPKRSSTTTTSPCATRVPFTSTSRGSPASLSSSTTEPWVRASRLRTLIRVRPTSNVRFRRTSMIRSRFNCPSPDPSPASSPDRKSTRLNSSHVKISYAVFCLKKKNKTMLYRERS